MSKLDPAGMLVRFMAMAAALSTGVVGSICLSMEEKLIGLLACNRRNERQSRGLLASGSRGPVYFLCSHLP